MASTNRSEPLSIESLLQKQREEKEAAAKPKFLSKEARAQLAIAKRAAEISEQRKKEEETRRDREALEKEAEELRRREGGQANKFGRYEDSSNSRYAHPERDRGPRGRGRGSHHRGDRDRDYGNVPTGPRADRSKPSTSANTPQASSSHSTSNTPGPQSSGSGAATPTPGTDGNYSPDVDMDAIRTRYLGVDKKKRKIRKTNDRKFVFDWDAQDDTAEDSSLVPASNQGPQPMFGRGHLAGIDLAHDLSTQDHLADTRERRKAMKTGIDERHWTEKPLNEMRERDWRIFREDFSISARDPASSTFMGGVLNPPQILECIEKIGYKEPSPIQRQAIPIGLMKRDVIGIAETGSGKTAAFVIPMLAFISSLPPFTEDNRHLGPYALILAPTRELAQQIETESKKFAGPLGFKCVSIVGGRAVEEQQFNLREGAEIIIATPGRLKDVIERHVLVLSQCRYVVMDEADRMVHLGFEADLTFILDKLPAETMAGEDQSMDVDSEGQLRAKGRSRVTTLFSATMPPAVERLARKYLKKPAVITIGEAGRAVDTVEQKVEFVSGEERKKQKLLEILNSNLYAPPIIVFVNQKKTADMVAKDLQRANWSTSTLHSGKTQEQREASLQALRDGHADVLVATDLAGRGIDVQDVSLVVNYQMASTIEAYVHRIGRTGRAGKMGTAITFLTNEDDEVMYDLKQEISKSPVSKVPIELAKHEAAQHKVSREMKRKRDAEDQG